MPPLTQDIDTPVREGALYVYPVAEDTVLYAGGIAVLNGSGNLIPGGTAAGVAVGRIEHQVDNTGGADGNVTAEVRRGVFRWKNDGADPVLAAQVGQLCYVVDDETVSIGDDGGSRIVAGTVEGVDDDGVWVNIGFAHNLGSAPA